MFGGRDDGAKESSKKVVSVNMLTVYAKQLQLHVDTSSSNTTGRHLRIKIP